MNHKSLIHLFIITFSVFFFASCSIVPHPNQRIIIGKWRPTEVEKVVDSSALAAAATLKGGEGQKQKTGAGRPAGEGGSNRKEAELDRLVQLEKKSTLEIFEDKTAIKTFPGKTLNATWKMKGRGKKIVAKNTENNQTFVLEILEINKERIVVMEHAPVGDVRITYMRVFDAN